MITAHNCPKSQGTKAAWVKMSSLVPSLIDFDEYQKHLATKAIISDDFDKPIKFIGGFDIDFEEDDNNSFVGQAALVIFEWPPSKAGWKPVWSQFISSVTKIDYCPGYLGMREAPFAQDLFKILQTEAPQFLPQVIIVDGCGRYHPRKCGSATQIGLELDVCTIGLSKSFLSLPGINEADFINTNLADRAPRPVIAQDGEIVAHAIYPTSSKHPLFVSAGHKISILTATDITIACCMKRIPEPIRIADALSRYGKI